MAEPDKESKPEGSPHWVRWVTRIALVAGAVGLAVTVWLVGPSTIWGHLRSIGWWFAVLFAVDAAMTLCDSAAIHTLMRGPRAPPFGHVVVAMVSGRAVNVVTPSGNLGEPLKASLLAEHSSGSRAVAAVMYVGVVSGCISLATIAIGAPLTILLIPDMPPLVDLVLVGVGLLAAAIVVTLVVLVRRGMLANLVKVGAKLRLVSRKRQKSWAKKLEEIDERLRGTAEPGMRLRASIWVFISKVLGWSATWIIVATAGHYLSAAQLVALLSAGIALSWAGTIVPMQLGVAESGNYGLFGLIGVAPALGVSLALARRVTQICFAAVGFAVLGVSKLVDKRIGEAFKRAKARRSQTRPRAGTSGPPSESPPSAVREAPAP